MIRILVAFNSNVQLRGSMIFDKALKVIHKLIFRLIRIKRLIHNMIFCLAILSRKMENLDKGSKLASTVIRPIWNQEMSLTLPIE